MADSREVTTTLTVSFGTGATADNDGLIAEVDPRIDGPNNNKTAFSPGDDVWILLYKTPNIVLNAPVVSAGSLILSAGSVAVEKEQDLIFVDETEATLAYPVPASGFVSSWVGNSLGNVVASGAMVLSVGKPVAAHWAGVLRVTHSPIATQYRLTNTNVVGFDDYTIIVHFTGTAS